MTWHIVASNLLRVSSDKTSSFSGRVEHPYNTYVAVREEEEGKKKKKQEKKKKSKITDPVDKDSF